MKTCVYVRCVNESTFLNAFFEHYIGLGFDMIYVLYNNSPNSNNYVVPTNFTPFVTIKNVYNIGNSLYDHHKSIIDKVKYDWVFITDLDEFLILHNRFLNITSLIEEYQTKDININTIQFPWVWSHKFSTEPETVLDILKTRKKFIGRLGLGIGKEVWYKMMVKTTHINMICIHSTQLKGLKTQIIGYNGKIEHINIDNQPDEKQIWTLWGDDYGFRKHDIDEGTYSDAFLLHITTRNMADVYAKTMEKQAHRDKKLNNKHMVSKIFNQLESMEVNEVILKSFTNAFGYRVEFPLRTTQFGNMNHDAIMRTFNIPLSTLPLYSIVTVIEGISPIVLSKIGKVLDKYFILD
jgi:hypothetical protein